MDKETTHELTQTQKLSDLAKSEGWQIAKAKLNDLIAKNASIFSIDAGSDRDRLLIEMEARKLATTIVLDWAKDIDGSILQDDYNKKVLENYKKNELVHRA